MVNLVNLVSAACLGRVSSTPSNGGVFQGLQPTGHRRRIPNAKLISPCAVHFYGNRLVTMVTHQHVNAGISPDRGGSQRQLELGCGPDISAQHGVFFTPSLPVNNKLIPQY